MKRRDLVAVCVLAMIALSSRTSARQKPQKESEDEQRPSRTICLPKIRCTELDSCEAARRQLEDCGATNLDRDRDGIPCESLCGSGKPRRR